MTRRILLAEDEANYRRVFRMMVDDLDVEIVDAEDGRAALDLLDGGERVDLVVTDLTMPRLTGMELLDELARRPDAPPAVVVTAYGSIESAVAAMQKGAIDYLQKPFDTERLHLTLRRALRMTDLLAENRRLREQVEERHDFSQLLGQSEALVRALDAAGKAARAETNVLIRGESGTGKELLARAVHFNSPRKDGPFVAVNCAAIPEGLLEAELFGAEAGAFTGATKKRKGRVELARGGTLFLDEIGDLPLPLQAKLLRLLQERTYVPLGGEREVRADVRFLFATHADLEQMVKDGGFREDLFWRVAVLPVTLPPLRERGDDVLALAESFIERFAEQIGRTPPALSAAAKQQLVACPWRGNVRELANVTERAVVLCEGDVLEPVDLMLDVTTAPGPRKDGPAAEATDPFALPEGGVVLEDVERALVRQALERTDGNKSQAARLLGLSRATLRYRVEKLGL